jgi:hypothetical protein
MKNVYNIIMYGKDGLQPSNILIADEVEAYTIAKKIAEETAKKTTIESKINLEVFSERFEEENYFVIRNNHPKNINELVNTIVAVIGIRKIPVAQKASDVESDDSADIK